MLNGLDLFSGIGGLSIALGEWVRPITYCENDRYAQAVILSRMCDGKIGKAPIWDDVRTLSAEDIPDHVDIISGGFPCQNLSVAGLGAGLGGERSGLFFEILRLAKEIRPKFIFLENVPAIRTRGLEHVAEGLAGAGYDCRWDFISAQEIGANHKRQRWFCLAHANGSELWNKQRRSKGKDREGQAFPGNDGKREPVSDAQSVGRDKWWAKSSPEGAAESNQHRSQLANSASEGLEGWLTTQRAWAALRLGGGGGGKEWPQGIPKPSLCRGSDGLLCRVDRLRGLGNSVVPAQAREAFERLMGLK